MVGIAAKCGVLPAAVGRIGSGAPQASKFRHMPVLDAVVDEIRRERLTREVRMPPRLRNSTDVGEPVDPMRLKERQKRRRSVCGVSD
jgi:hypothetical protein